MSATSLGRNSTCPCGSGRKYKKCCLARANAMPPQPAGRNGEHLGFVQTPAQMDAARERAAIPLPKGFPPASPTYWAHQPGQPDAAPPASGEWLEYVFVKDKGWTHERDLKPGDQYRLKGGLWETVQPEQVIRTTQEHPFFVQGKGWTPAGEIKSGDVIRTEEGWVPVSESKDTGQWETVYNLRVADFHTYFVGRPEWGFSVWAHNAGFEYGPNHPEAVAGVHFPEGQAKARANLDPAHRGETVRVKAPGTDIDVTATSSVADGKSYVTYAFVDKKTGNIDYVGRARTPSGVSDTSIQKAVQERLRGHKRDGTFDPETQAVVALDAQQSYAAHRGAEQFFNDLYEARGTLKRNSYQPLDAIDSRTRQKSVGYMNSFFEERLGYQNPGITTEIDARIAQRGRQ